MNAPSLLNSSMIETARRKKLPTRQRRMIGAAMKMA
jgi:hypothetical protein